MTRAGPTGFRGYARYYDLLYGDKDYSGEIAFVESLVRRHAPGARRVLELGCGTGAHAGLLAARGYDVTGVELSADMVERARQRAAALPAEVSARLRFEQGDARSFETADRFDVVLSLFHVMSYQLTNADLAAVFSRAQAHLAPGGLFLFDCWYGPAVLTDRPTRRVKHMANADTSAVRTAEPVMHPNENIVDVSYRLVATDHRTGQVEEVSELHRMRYLFRPEVELLAETHGLRIVAGGAWMTEQPMDCSTWYVYFALQHRAC